MSCQQTSVRYFIFCLFCFATGCAMIVMIGCGAWPSLSDGWGCYSFFYCNLGRDCGCGCGDGFCFFAYSFAAFGFADDCYFHYCFWPSPFPCLLYSFSLVPFYHPRPSTSLWCCPYSYLVPSPCPSPFH